MEIEGAVARSEEPLAQRTRVLGLYVGFMDTDLTAGIDASTPDSGDLTGLSPALGR